MYEEFFTILYYFRGGVSWRDLWSMPIQTRKWLIGRLNKQFEDEQNRYESMIRKKPGGKL